MANKRECPVTIQRAIADIKADQIKADGEARYQEYVNSLEERERPNLVSNC